jgi:hypothetical protein
LVGSCSTVGYVTVTADNCAGLTCSHDTYFETCDGTNWNGCFCDLADLPSGYDDEIHGAIPPSSDGMDAGVAGDTEQPDAPPDGSPEDASDGG